MTINIIAKTCLSQFSKADHSMLSSMGFDYALEWVEWAHRTGMDCLQFHTAGQLHRIADEIFSIANQK